MDNHRVKALERVIVYFYDMLTIYRFHLLMYPYVFGHGGSYTKLSS